MLSRILCFKPLPKCCCIVVLLWFYLPSLHAELPLSVEDLITHKGHIKAELSLYYANLDKQQITTGDYVVIQTGETSFILVPSRVGEGNINSDLLVGTIGLRYGVTAHSEIYSRASWLYSAQRLVAGNQTKKTYENRFTDAWLGLNYQFQQSSHFGLLGFIEVAVAEKQRHALHHIKSYSVGVTSYYSIDPIVFAITAAYRLNQPRTEQHIEYKPGNYLLLHPSVSFAANDKVTLSMGLRWLHSQASQRNRIANGLRNTRSDIVLGVGYGASRNNTLNATLTANHSGRHGADLRVTWLHRF